MVLPSDCPPWEYESHPLRPELAATTAELLKGLRRSGATRAAAKDTRPVHWRLFRRLTPPGVAYYAGHYRGEEYRCLKTYEVTIPADARVGTPAARVLGSVSQLSAAIERLLAALDSGTAVPKAQLPEADRLLCVVAVASRVFVELLTIHPYANGNGHAARFCVWTILGRYGYWPNRWPIDPRPPDPPYSELIVRYRNGEREPLERFIMGSI